MSKKIKHPMHILVIDKEFTDELPGMNLQHGVTRLTSDQYAHWLDVAATHLMTGLREKMEYDPRFRQILPYTPVVFSDTPDNIDWANSPLFLYQRTKQIGEERLAGNFSIGTGGHVDDDDVETEKSIVNFKGTIDTNLAREVAVEELEFLEPAGKLSFVTVSPESHPQFFKFIPFGLIRDDSNNVGKVHLGVVNVIVVPTWMRARCKENELITHDPKTAKELKDAGLKFEGWTQILIDEMCGVPCSVAPAARREVQYDLISGQYFITSKKDDKWTELAIELNCTVATLYRLNLADYEGNDIAEGTRVIVPDQPDDLIKVETPQNLIDALNNDAAGSRAKADEILETSGAAQAERTTRLLQQVLSHGPNYENCGLVFLVTQEVADRLMLLDPAICHLIEHGVVSIVPETHIPGESITLDKATAEQAKAGQITWHFPKSGRPSMPAPNPIPSTFEDSPFDNAGVPGDVTLDAVVAKTDGYLEMPNPTNDELKSPLFEAIWKTIKNWDVNVPTHYAGYCGANGSHVKLILDGLREIPSAAFTINGEFVVEGNPAKSQDEQLGDAINAAVDVGFMRQVKLGEANGTPRHPIEIGDSINSICEKYAINHEDFERWNGFERGNSWPTPTGYVFIADPALKWVPLLESDINEVSLGRGDTKPYEEPTL